MLSLPAAALLLVVGDVFDDVQRVWLPHRDGHFYVLLNWHVHLPDDLVRSLNWDWNLPDDLNWHLFDDFNWDWPLYLNVLGLVYWVGNVLHNVYVDGVRLRYWHLDFLRDWDRHCMRHSDFNVTGYFNGNAADDVLYDGLKLE